MIVVHVTHEAVEKVGGIGAVIAGLMTAKSYEQSVSRTVLLGPLLTTDKPVNLRLGEGGHVIYSSLDAVYTPPWREKFLPIERTYDVGIIYGTRKVHDPCCGKTVDAEVLLIDVFHANKNRLNLFKGELYRKFNVPSADFEKIWEYEQYVRLAEPGFEALKAIGCNGGSQQVVILAHEYMGMPVALKVVLAGSANTRTVFYAHEVASVRPIVEKTPGHDTMFYNVMVQAAAEDKTMEEIFPSVFNNYKHALVKAARYCDHVFAVGDYIEEELRFLDPHFRTMDIDLVYNGVPAFPLAMADKKASRARMRAYSRNLFGREPTWIFTHVCRPVLSKGLWRDLRLLHELEPYLAQRGETAVYFLLGTLAGQRRPQDIRHMERVYGWPVSHEKGYPDLCGGEEELGSIINYFNRDHRCTRGVLVNQWDWNQRFCGERMPADMTFADIRCGTDVELGMSIYEPFGISQFEALCFGAICVASNICGCMGFARKAAGLARFEPPDDPDAPLPCPNIIEANFLNAGNLSVEKLLALSIEDRDKIESAEGARMARALIRALPRSDKEMEALIASGYELAQKMSWEHVVQDYFLPSLGRTVQ
ncbi:MAG: hypothetical protein ACE15C_01640 [Phycisphaerae bacterium]